MKKFLLLALVLLGLGLAAYYLNPNRDQRIVEEPVIENTENYSDSEIGLEFAYKGGEGGYVLVERNAATSSEDNLLKTITLYDRQDFENLGNVPQGGEGPAVIAINIFKNAENDQSGNWADKNIAYSNINLINGGRNESVVGGANAIRYMADGLYASDNAVVAHGGFVYVFTGQYMDAGSSVRTDFNALIDSVRFISAPGQE